MAATTDIVNAEIGRIKALIQAETEAAKHRQQQQTQHLQQEQQLQLQANIEAQTSSYRIRP